MFNLIHLRFAHGLLVKGELLLSCNLESWRENNTIAHNQQQNNNFPIPKTLLTAKVG